MKLHSLTLQPDPRQLSQMTPRTNATDTRILTATGKYYPRSRLEKRKIMATKARTHKHKVLAIDRESLKLVCFDQKPSAEIQNVERDAIFYKADNPTKCKFTILELRFPVPHLDLRQIFRTHVSAPNHI